MSLSLDPKNGMKVMRWNRPMVLVTAACALACAGRASREPQVQGANVSTRAWPYAWTVGADDTDDDGRNEILIGGGGKIRLYCGRTGRLLSMCEADRAALLCDRNGDDVTDFLVLRSGSAVCVDGVRLVPLDGSNLGDVERIEDIAVAGDLDNDGVPELVIGTSDLPRGAPLAAGAVLVLSGATGQPVATIAGQLPHDQLGQRVFAARQPGAAGRRITCTGAGFMENVQLGTSSDGGVHVESRARVSVGPDATQTLNSGDLDNDGWLDVVMAVSWGGGDGQSGNGLRVVSSDPSVGVLAQIDMPITADLCRNPWTDQPSIAVIRSVSAMGGPPQLLLGLRATVTVGSNSEQCYRGHVTLLSYPDLIRTCEWATDEIFTFARDIDGLHPGSRCYDTPWSIGEPGDVDRDGVLDVLVVPEQVERGQAFVLSGATKRRIVDLQIAQ